MNKLTDSFVLSNGVKVPCIGYGTYLTPDGEIAKSSVMEAIKAGNADLAEQLANRHMINAYENMVKNGLQEIYAVREEGK